MRSARVAAGFSVLLVLGACGANHEELQQWMEQQRREAKPSVEPLSAPKKFTPQVYLALTGVEPFSTQKLTVALKQETRQPNSLMAAEINRRKEPLESFPLDAMSMVGSVAKAGAPVALLPMDTLIAANSLSTLMNSQGASEPSFTSSPRPSTMWVCGLIG